MVSKNVSGFSDFKKLFSMCTIQSIVLGGLHWAQKDWSMGFAKEQQNR